VPVLVAGVRLDGVVERSLDPHEDARGSLTEVFADDWTGLDGRPVQWSVVRSGTGVLRGMHLHRRHSDVVHVISGHLTVGFHDIRPGSPTEGLAATYELCGERPSLLCCPAGVVHGWLAHEPTVHLQGVSEAYSSYGADDNTGCHWSDPALGIDWPFTPTLISDRAAGFGPLADLLSDG